MSLKKHVGRLKNTDRRCVVVMTSIPGREDHALIVDTDALPDRFHDTLMHVVDSHEGQQVMELHTLLSRRIVPDFGVDILNALHNANALTAQPVDNIIMFPQPHSPVPLSMIVEMLKNNADNKVVSQTDLENRHLENQKVDASEQEIATARNLLLQANDLQAEADKKREQAYRIAPSLRPAAFPEEGQMQPGANPETPVQVSEAPVETPTATIEEIAVVTDISPESGEPNLPFDVAPVDPDLPPDVAAAYAAAVEQASQLSETQADILQESVDEDEAAHAVDASDDALQAFLDRAAYREDRANKIAIEAAEPKRPVGRPRKDGTPAGSPRA